MPTTPPETLLALAQQLVTLYEDAQGTAQRELARATSELAEARGRLTEHTDELAENQRILAEDRNTLALSEVPADAAALLEEIAGLQVEARALQAEILDDGDAVNRADARLKAATRLHTRISSALSAARAELSVVTTHAQRRAAWQAAATAVPLDTLAADAGTALGGAAFTDARTRVEAEIPERLLESARAGWEAEQARLEAHAASMEAVEALLRAERQANGGPEGSIVNLQRDLQRAEAELRACVEQAFARYSRALLRLGEVVAGLSLLTLAEAEALAALDVAGSGAADERAARETARIAVIAAELAVDDALTTALAPDIAADVSADPAVVAANIALADAVTTFEEEDEDYRAFADGTEPPTFAENFSAWSAAVPEAVWRRVVGYLEAEATLAELRDVDGQALADAVSEVEQELAEALFAARQHALSTVYLEAQLALREDLREQVHLTRQQRLLAAVRGDA